jgi:hypothetical protein
VSVIPVDDSLQLILRPCSKRVLVGYDAIAHARRDRRAIVALLEAPALLVERLDDLRREDRRGQLGSLNPELRGDVETIVAKALEKDLARRYPSAADLAADLRRWLAHEPIQARPPSALYQLRQFARRHKALVGGVLATVAALILGLVGTILFAVGEARQRRQAEQNAQVADDKTREAKVQAYLSCIAAAVAALSANDVADAAHQLDAAPKALPDWEWRHLSSRLDDSSAVVRLRPSDPAFLLSDPEGLRVGTFTRTGLRYPEWLHFQRNGFVWPFRLNGRPGQARGACRLLHPTAGVIVVTIAQQCPAICLTPTHRFPDNHIPFPRSLASPLWERLQSCLDLFRESCNRRLRKRAGFRWFLSPRDPEERSG